MPRVFDVPLATRRIISRLPRTWQQELHRLRCWWDLRHNTFGSREPEYPLLHLLVREGDWVIDIGANIGYYTARLSALVGPNGRVFAFEPVPDTFQILVANSRYFAHQNTTLLNLAVSSAFCITGIEIPLWESGLRNYYTAHLSPAAPLRIVCCPVDSFQFPKPICLIKIDAEGCEADVLQGLMNLLQRDHPLLIIEGESESIRTLLASLGYGAFRLAGSPNRIFSIDAALADSALGAEKIA